MAPQEMMALHPEMSLHQKVQRLQEMMLDRVKNLRQKVLMGANPLQRLLQMDLLREMDLLLATLPLQEMWLLLEILLLDLLVLLLVMH